MKKEGIYTTISPYWASGGHTGTAASWGIEGYGDKADLLGLALLQREIQGGLQGVDQGAARPRPTPTPAFLWPRTRPWRSSRFRTRTACSSGPCRASSRGSWKCWARSSAHWLVKKYGSLERRRGLGRHAKPEGDNFAEGNVGILIVWHMTQARRGAPQTRMRDQIHFFAETQ